MRFTRLIASIAACGVSGLANGQGQVVGWGSNGSGELGESIESVLPFDSISGGIFHTVARRADGSVICWGSDLQGQSTIPAELGLVVQIDAGGRHTVARRIDGSVVCWGSNDAGQCAVPPALGSAIWISGGIDHTLAVGPGGIVFAWGSNAQGQSSPPASASPSRAVSAGTDHSMSLRTDGTVVCWGSNGSGKCTVPPGLASVSSIAAGGTFSAALRTDGSIVLWGGLGQGSIPTGLPAIRSIDAGESHCIVLGVDGVVRAFGMDIDGQSTVPTLAPGVRAIGAGAAHSLAVTVDGQAAGWGLDNLGQASPPLRLRQAERVSAGNSFSAAVNSLDRVRAWGLDNYRQATPPSSIGTVTDAICGYQHMVARTTAGQVVAWGSNEDNYGVVHGQATVPNGIGATLGVGAGWFHSIAIRSDGSVVCWGAGLTNTGVDRNHGQSIVPSPLTNVVDVSGGGLHTMALRQNGVVRCWGAGTTVSGSGADYGQSIVPGDLLPVTAIAAGGLHSVALQNDGTVRCWGANVSGQSSVPAGLGPVIRIAAGGYHTVALLADERVVCWGQNTQGQCSVPTGLGPVAQIAAGVDHTIARLKTIASGCNNPAGTGTATVAISGASWQDVAAWAWTDGGGPQTPGTLTNVDLGRFGSIGSLCDAQCGTFTSRAGSTLIIPVDLGIPMRAQEDHAVSVATQAVLSGRILLLASGAAELPKDLDIPILRVPSVVGSFDVIRSTVPAPDGLFLTLVPVSALRGEVTYSLRLLPLQVKPRSLEAQGAAVAGEVVAAETIDWDGDGFDDLALAIDFGPAQPGRLQVLRNDGQGNLGQGDSVLVNTSPRPTCLAIEDMNRDGKPDAVVGTASDAVARIFLNAFPIPPSGGPPFTLGPALVVTGGVPLSVTVLPRQVSLLGTDEAEVVVGSKDEGTDGGSVEVFSDSDGDGVPDDQTEVVSVPSTPATTTNRGRRVVTGGASSTTLGGSGPGRVVVLRPSGPGGSYQTGQVIDVPGIPRKIALRDINRDGAAEVICANEAPQVQGVGSALPVLAVLRGTESPAGDVYGDPIPIAPTGASEGVDVVLVDADGDLDRDIVCINRTVGDQTQATLIRIDTQAGAPGGVITIGEEIDLAVQSPAFCTRGNLDGEGGEDVFIVQADGAQTLLGASIARPVLLSGEGGCPADLDGDGDVDGADLGIILVRWGSSGQGDINGDGIINGADLGALLVAWGPCGS